ncbi:porin family protein [bacterium]|nr:porin family protein [bacterium]
MAIRCFLFFCIGLLATQLQAQRPKYQPQVHEIGLQLINYNLIPEYSDANASAFNFGNGIRYRYHFNIFDSFRAGLFYRTSDFDKPRVVEPLFSEFSAKKRDYEIKFGYERKYNFRKVQVFGGIDLIVNYSRIRAEGQDLDDADFEGLEKHFGIGTGTYIGVRYFINKQLSVAGEFDYYVIRPIGGSSTIGVPPDNNFRLFPDRETGTNMVSIYVSYHFKKMRKSCTCGKPGK